MEELSNKFLLLKPHSFLAKQTQFFNVKKGNLDDEVLVVLDYSENHKYIAQDAFQAFHFNNTQCTVFPVVCYFKENSTIKHKSLVFLLESTRHDTAAVYMQKNVNTGSSGSKSSHSIIFSKVPRFFVTPGKRPVKRNIKRIYFPDLLNNSDNQNVTYNSHTEKNNEQIENDKVALPPNNFNEKLYLKHQHLKSISHNCPS